MKKINEMNKFEKIEYFKKNIDTRSKKLILGFESRKNRFQIEKNKILIFKEINNLKINNEEMNYLSAYGCLSDYAKQLIYFLYTCDEKEYRKIFLKALYYELEDDVMSLI